MLAVPSANSKLAVGADGDDLIAWSENGIRLCRGATAHGLFAIEHDATTKEFAASNGEGRDDTIPVALAFESHVIAHGLNSCRGKRSM
jgi:hypothetical protein